MTSYHLGQMTFFYDAHIMIQNPSVANAPCFSSSIRNICLLTLNTHAQKAEFESQSKQGRKTLEVRPSCQDQAGSQGSADFG